MCGDGGGGGMVVEVVEGGVEDMMAEETDGETVEVEILDKEKRFLSFT